MILSRPEPLGVTIADALRRDIVSGRLAGGTELRQEELAEKFGTSRIPVREAMQALERDGLIVVHANRRSVVAEFRDSDLRDHYGARALLEGEAAAMCVGREADTVALAEIQDELERVGVEDAGAYEELNRQFHAWIWAESGSRWIERLAGILWQGISPRTPGLVPGQADLAREEHRAIIEALASGDAERARAAVRAHIDRSCESLLTYRSESTLREAGSA